MLGALEDHVLQRVADSGYVWRFIAGPGVHIQAQGNQRETLIRNNQDFQSVIQLLQNIFVIGGCCVCGLKQKQAGQAQAESNFSEVSHYISLITICYVTNS